MITHQPMQTAGSVTLVLTALSTLLGVVVLSGLVATAAGYGFRAVTTRRLPAGAAVLLGLAAAGAWLLSSALLDSQFAVGLDAVSEAGTAFLLGAFLFGAVAAVGGRPLGDYVARTVHEIALFEGDDDVRRFLRSAGLVVELRLPDRIGDPEGYRPVDDQTKRALVGRTMSFPRRLSTAELEERLVCRIERDFDLDYVDTSVTAEGRVETLRLGREPPQIGPSLPPGSLAVTVRARTASVAAQGDPVEIWRETEQGSDLVATGRLHSTFADTATLIVDENDAPAFDADSRYRLTTRADEKGHRSELLSVIRAADETVTKISVEDQDPLEGEFAEWLPVSVPVVDRDGEAIVYPSDAETLQAGDTAYVVGTPADIEALAQYERDRDRSASGMASAVVSADGRAEQ